MPIDTSVPQSPGWWLERLRRKLERRRKRVELLDSYLRGDPPIPEGMQRLRPVYQEFVKTSRTNFALLVSEAPRERMQLVGVRTGADTDGDGDEVAWALWRRCGLPVASADVHRMMLGLGDAYVIVGWDGSRGLPVVTAEDPRQVVTIHDPRDQRRVLAALKLFRDDEAGWDYAYLYLPGRVFVASRPLRSWARPAPSFDARSWEWDEALSGPLPDAFGDVVPVVRFRNLDGQAEFEAHIDVLDRINRTMLRRMVVTTFQAFRQRAIKGDLPETDEQGNVVDYEQLLQADPGAFWLLPPDVELWESGVIDLTPILSAIKDDVLMLAAVTRTPLPMLTPDAVAQSAEGASLQREGLVFKTEDRIARADDGWAQVVSLMFRFAGDAERASVDAIEPIWAPIERYSLQEMSNAWAQFGADMPFETKLRYVFRADPAEIARVKTEQQDTQIQMLLAQAAAQPPQPAAPAAAPAVAAPAPASPVPTPPAA